MPSKPKKLAVSAASLSLPTIPKELIDQFVAKLEPSNTQKPHSKANKSTSTS